MQAITGAHDKTIRLWDIRKPSTMATLTYHKKSVRALAMHPTECGPPARMCCDPCETQPLLLAATAGWHVCSSRSACRS